MHAHYAELFGAGFLKDNNKLENGLTIELTRMLTRRVFCIFNAITKNQPKNITDRSIVISVNKSTYWISIWMLKEKLGI